MPEKTTPSIDPEVSSQNELKRLSYTTAYRTAEEHKALMADNSPKGLLRRGGGLVVDALMHTTPNVRHGEFIQFPDRFEKASTAYFKENEEALRAEATELDAMHDARVAGSEAAVAVQSISAQDQNNS